MAELGLLFCKMNRVLNAGVQRFLNVAKARIDNLEVCQ